MSAACLDAVGPQPGRSGFLLSRTCNVKPPPSLPSVCGVPSTSCRTNRWTVSPTRNVKNVASLRQYQTVRRVCFPSASGGPSYGAPPPPGSCDEREVRWPTPVHDIDVQLTVMNGTAVAAGDSASVAVLREVARIASQITIGRSQLSRNVRKDAAHSQTGRCGPRGSRPHLRARPRARREGSSWATDAKSDLAVPITCFVNPPPLLPSPVNGRAIPANSPSSPHPSRFRQRNGRSPREGIRTRRPPASVR